MHKYDKFELLLKKTKKISLTWKKSYGIAPENVTKKVDLAMLDWQYELTKTLKIWLDKGENMTDGELILARVNLGAVVEFWLRFFYCAYYDDYIEDPMKNKKGKVIEPEKGLRFEDLKKFSTGILWKDENTSEYAWIDKIQHKRNAIHSFTYKDIGNSHDFFDDMDKLYEFVDDIISRLPPLEDCIECFLQDILI